MSGCDGPDRGDDLIQRCLNGEQSAWNALIDAYSGLVYSIARDHGLSSDDCDDVCQIVFAILFRRLGSIEDHRALPKWLMVTTRRECWRQRRNRPDATPLSFADAHGTGPGSGSDHSADPMESAEERSRVRAALSQIGDRCRRLLMALFGPGEPAPYQAISEQLGVPVGSIGPTRARCLRELAMRLEALEGSDGAGAASDPRA